MPDNKVCHIQTHAKKVVQLCAVFHLFAMTKYTYIFTLPMIQLHLLIEKYMKENNCPYISFFSTLQSCNTYTMYVGMDTSMQV